MSRFFLAKPVWLLVLLGVGLRFYQLSQQIVIGDEWHALHVALAHDYGYILSHFDTGGHSIPIALYYRFLIDTLGLSELGVHLPSLLAGVGLVVFLPRCFRAVIGQQNANVFMALLALSPLLIFYSRFARPYGLLALLSCLAIWAFYRYWKQPETYSHWAYIFLAASSVYLHLIALPFVLSPFLFVWLLGIYQAQGLDTFKKLLPTGLILLALLALLLMPALWLDAKAIVAKTEQSSIQFAQLLPIFAFFLAGIQVGWLHWLSAALLVIGIWAAFRQPVARDFYALLLFASVSQIVLVFVSKPLAGDASHIFSRYIIVVLPVVLLFIANGMVYLAQLIKTPVVFNRLCLGLYVGLLIWQSSMLTILSTYSQSAGLQILANMVFGRDFQEKMLTQHVKTIPDFYQKLALEPVNSQRIVEVPFHYNDYLPFIYQLQHRQPFYMGLTERLCPSSNVFAPQSIDDLVKFEYLLDLRDHAALQEKQIDYVVFHKQPEAEVNYPVEYQALPLDACIAAYRQHYGSAWLEDAHIVVFLLKS